ncbi:MAG: hypothetical protein ACLTZF_11265, partial [Oscillospiraceae bacterium]
FQLRLGQQSDIESLLLCSDSNPMKRNCTAQIPESIPLMTQVTRDSSSAVQMYGICYIKSSIGLGRCVF